MDGDGIDDLVVAAKCKNPMADRDEYSFVVADPYDSFLGFGDVKVTSSFASDEPERRGVSLLIIHGAEKDAWRAETPKAKFLLINHAFQDPDREKADAEEEDDSWGLYGRKGRRRTNVLGGLLGWQEVPVSAVGVNPGIDQDLNHRGHRGRCISQSHAAILPTAAALNHIRL